MGIQQINKGRNQGRYVIDWRDEHGRRRREILGYSHRQAHDVLAKKITDRAENRSLDVRPGDGMTFRELAERYLNLYAKERKASWKTDEGKIVLFNAAFGEHKIGQVNKTMVNEYAMGRKIQVQGGTVNKEIAILKKIFEFAIDNDWLEKNPARKWDEYPENPAHERYLQFGEYQALLEATERLMARPGNGWRGKPHLGHFRIMIPLAFEAGGRREEIVLLKESDLDFNARMVRFWYKKGRKHELKSRWVPMTERLYHLLKKMPKNPDSPTLFPDEDGGIWKSKISFYRQWENIVKESKVKDCLFHTLRHSYNTHLALNGVDESTRMRLMGHTSPVTQQRYTHISDEHKKKAAKVLDFLGKEIEKNVPGRNSLDVIWTFFDKSVKVDNYNINNSILKINTN
jgi:integrase